MAKVNSDCTVLYVGASRTNYEAARRALGLLGMSAMWCENIDASLFLVRTGEVRVVLCDPHEMDSRCRNFLSHLDAVAPDTCKLVMELPTESDDPKDIKRNAFGYARLLKSMGDMLSFDKQVAKIADKEIAGRAAS